MNSNYMNGQALRLVRDVTDDETGYGFPMGAPALFEQDLGGMSCLVVLDQSLGDVHDSGSAEVMVRYDDVEPA